MQQPEADSEIKEEHLLNFVVNSLNEELAIDLDENVKVTTETLYEVLAGASAGGTSINHVCETTDDSPHANTVRGHLTDQFDLDTVEAVGDTLLQRDALETLPDRPVEVLELTKERHHTQRESRREYQYVSTGSDDHHPTCISERFTVAATGSEVASQREHL